MRVRWRPEAAADLSRIFRHIAEANPVAARRVAREILLAGESLLLFPRRGRLGMAPETRELLAVIPYVIVYEVVDGEVFILRVWHGAQDR